MGHGGMSCGMKTIRFIVVVFNIFFFLIGLALLAGGIYVKVDPSLSKLKQVLPINGNPGVQQGLSYLDAIAIAIIVLGCVLVIISFLGCCGAMKQVKVFLGIYAIIIAIIVAIEVGVTIYFVAFQSKFQNQIVGQLTTAVQTQYQGPNKLLTNDPNGPNALTLAWDFVMYNLKCCGVNSPSDLNTSVAVWNRTNPWYNPSNSASPYNFTFPITCCNISSAYSSNWDSLPASTLSSYTTCAATGNGIYQTGCYPQVLNYINTAKTWVIAGAVIILVIELFTIIFALALCCRKRHDRYSS